LVFLRVLCLFRVFFFFFKECFFFDVGT